MNPSDLPLPSIGGSYLRDPVTGDLTLIPDTATATAEIAPTAEPEVLREPAAAEQPTEPETPPAEPAQGKVRKSAKEG